MKNAFLITKQSLNIENICNAINRSPKAWKACRSDSNWTEVVVQYPKELNSFTKCDLFLNIYKINPVDWHWTAQGVKTAKDFDSEATTYLLSSHDDRLYISILIWLSNEHEFLIADVVDEPFVSIGEYLRLAKKGKIFLDYQFYL